MNTFANYIHTDEIMFKYAKGNRDIIGRESHTYHEIFLFLEGNAEFISESFSLHILPYTLILIPKECFHQFYVHGDESDYCRCVLNFDVVHGLEKVIPTVFSDIAVIFSVGENVRTLFEKLMKLSGPDTADEDKEIILGAIFTMILMEIRNYPKIQKMHNNHNPVVNSAITYIEQNILSCLTAQSVANGIHVSVSYLSHIFKKELHISVYQYILKKKLLLAHRLINQNIPPMQAALQCGFRNYSGFYRMYKKHIGTTPSNKIHKIE